MTDLQSSKVIPVIAIHGGAGNLELEAITPEEQRAYKDGLLAALKTGAAILLSGGTAMDAVTASVVALEDNPLFNSGRGASYTSNRTHEMDAAVMRGEDGACGAVAGVCGPRNPVRAARAVMERTSHVLLSGEGARVFCEGAGLEMAEAEWFGTEARMASLEKVLAAHESGSAGGADRHGTVGAVALDAHGHVAAATSTGGMVGKLPGRVGDSPVIGAGTWASDRTCAVSCTGDGELFIRYAVAHEVDARMRLCGHPLDAAASTTIRELRAFGGSGGLIAVDTNGNIALPFNCSGMFRAWMGRDGVSQAAIFDI